MIPDSVLQRFVLMWGDAYDYSKAEYVSKKDDILIRCKKHDLWFHATPEMHEKSRCCPACNEEIRRNQEKRINDAFIKKCKGIYGDKYTYEKVKYTYSAKSVIITCPVHGDVEVTVKSLLAGHGCNKCNRENSALKKRKTWDDTLNDFIKVHGNAYDYDSSTFTRNNKPMKILCRKHGEFWQTPAKHKSGQGCPICANEKIGELSKLSREEFIEKANEVHNFKYDYSLTDFRGTQEKAVFVCHERDENGLEHGPFEQICSSHLRGRGCPKCAQVARNKFFTNPFSEFVERAKKVHKEENYTYDESTYKNFNTPTKIICPTHGEFWQKPVHHLRGHGCPKCAKSGILKTYEEFEESASQVHNDKYVYHHDYVNNRTKVRITCPIHGDFYQEANAHLQGHGCPKCSLMVSEGENWLLKIIEDASVSSDVITRDRNILDNKEIDILLNDLKIGFEYNGLVWHSEMFNKDKLYHINKTELAESKGYSLIHIFEDEHLNKPDIVEANVKRIIGCKDGFIDIELNKCLVKEVPHEEMGKFLDKNDIEGVCKATVHVACFLNNDIVCGMSFLRDRENKSKWTVVRSCLRNNVNNKGLFELIYKHFLDTYKPIEIIAYEDRRWSKGKDSSIYLKLGFVFEEYTKPKYYYYYKKKSKLGRIKRTDFRTSVLTKKYNFNIEEGNKEKLEARLGFVKIWDCGQIKYKYINNLNKK